MAIIKDTDVDGKRVILEDASDVGSVTDIYVNTTDWRVTKIEVKLEKRYTQRLGLEKGILKKTRIGVPIHLLKSVGDVVHLKANMDELARSQKMVLTREEPREAPPPKPAPAKRSEKAPAKAPAKPPAPAQKPQEARKPRKL